MLSLLDIKYPDKRDASDNVFFLHIQLTRFQTKSLQSPGTYMSEHI